MIWDPGIGKLIMRGAGTAGLCVVFSKLAVHYIHSLYIYIHTGMEGIEHVFITKSALSRSSHIHYVYRFPVSQYTHVHSRKALGVGSTCTPLVYLRMRSGAA